ncbi:LNS2-domain-containing protein [Pholiota conissans]|uniref:phosphatidate phosphatase n=1 Tax=Pholiota conissans TaxID=109636 RepID=A0A9P5Z4U3_9AGAR|nr:LNS2-domain-containing protein [Pholiota conissans]
MNYIRGAVNAISAPYQYYKELPPINPATLTGAIDVIVIQRPTENGGTELVCSPFHVRFGKWQVLRPGEKKVNVFVNGNPIPFNMKIGQAGEAFFVFETDEDVPADLITSPILQPTIPGKDEIEEEIVGADRFGAKDESKEQQEDVTSEPERTRVEPDFLDLNANANEEVPPTPRQQYRVTRSLRKSGSKATLMQTSLPSPPPSRDSSVERSRTPEMNEQDTRADEALKALRAQVHVPEVEYHHDVTLDMEGYKSDYHNRDKLDEKGEIAFSQQDTSNSSVVPDFIGHDAPKNDTQTAQGNISEKNYGFDTNGYKSGNHDRERSDQTIREQFVFLRQEGSNQRPVSLLPHNTQSADHTHPPSSDASASPSPSSSPIPGPTNPHSFRATSEPPPDTETDIDPGQILTLSATHGHGHGHAEPLHLQVPVEYSWEWGAFPQPSPMKTSFGKGGRIEPSKVLWTSTKDGASSIDNRKGTLSERKGRFMEMQLPSVAPICTDNDKNDGEEDYEVEHQPKLTASGSGLIGRSRSVPSRFLGSPARKGRRGSREYKEYEDVKGDPHAVEDQGDEERGRGWLRSGLEEGEEATEISPQEVENEAFGDGGVLSASRDDLTTFVLSIEGRKVAFQLSLIPTENENRSGKDELKEPLRDEMETARLFDNYCIDWSRFLDDEVLVHDPRLVIRWARNQYITRTDGSPLMDALVRWRSAALKKRASGDVLRPVSPPPPTDEFDKPDVQLDAQQKSHERSKSDVTSLNATDKREFEESGKHGESPPKKPTSSSWVAWWNRSRRKETMGESAQQPFSVKDASTISLPIPKDKPFADEKTKGLFAADVKTGSVPATPVQHPADDTTQPLSELGQDTTPKRRTAATLATGMVSSHVKKFAKTLRLTSDQLKSLNLKPGPNSITFSLSASGAIAATARIFVWDSADLVVISDIDGTITKSDGLGHVFAMIGRDWTHLGVAKLYTDIVKNGYKIMYLTSRAIGQADATRDYLKGIKQNNYQLPEGPVIMSPDRLMASLHREVIMRKPEVFKMACLRDIQRLFGESARNPFYAGFGNRITDALSYRSVNVPSARIFTIDSSGEVKMELLELAGYKSSYIHMTDLVDQMFPPIHRKWTPEFTDFNYWKTPMQDYPLPDLSPPSPALSARSDTSSQSTLARLRNFSLGGNASATARQAVSRQSTISSISDAQNATDGSPYRNSHLRQMSSFEKLSSTLGFMSKFNDDHDDRRSASPSSSSYLGSDDEDEDVEIGADGRRRRTRRRSMTSMPGTLDERHFELDDDEDDKDDERQFLHHDEDDEEEEGDEEEIEHDAEGLDEDILAAGEMANVPFL